MYEDYFGLTDKPFSILPDPGYIYWGRTHSMAYAMLQYGLMNRAGFTVVTGEIGCGKTTLIRQLLSQVDDELNIGVLSNVRRSDNRLLDWILMEFGQQFGDETYVGLYNRFRNYLIGEYAERGRTILIVDEAQNLGMKNLEELRMLSNINADKDQLLQLVLLGQPQLRDMLQRPELRQFTQRVSSDFHIRPLVQEETDAYIIHRINVAGGDGEELIAPEARRLVFEASGGVPRVINILCDTALVYAFASLDKQVKEATIRKVLADKQQYGVFQIDGAAKWPTPLKEVAPQT